MKKKKLEIKEKEKEKLRRIEEIEIGDEIERRVKTN